MSPFQSSIRMIEIDLPKIDRRKKKNGAKFWVRSSPNRLNPGERMYRCPFVGRVVRMAAFRIGEHRLIAGLDAEQSQAGHSLQRMPKLLDGDWHWVLVRYGKLDRSPIARVHQTKVELLLVD